jgi:hypothetical protein
MSEHDRKLALAFIRVAMLERGIVPAYPKPLSDSQVKLILAKVRERLAKEDEIEDISPENLAIAKVRVAQDDEDDEDIDSLVDDIVNDVMDEGGDEEAPTEEDEGLDLDTVVTEDNYDDIVSQIDSGFSELEETPEGEESAPSNGGVDAEQTVDLISRMVDMVTLLLKASPPELSKTASESDYNRVVRTYLKMAKMLEAEKKKIRKVERSKGGKYKTTYEDGTVQYLSRDPTRNLKKTDRGFEPVKEKTTEEEEAEAKKKKPEPKPEEETPKQEAPAEAPSEQKPSWHKDDEPLDPENDDQMTGRGFTKGKAEIGPDTTFVDVTTGKEVKFSGLPEDVQAAVQERNSQGNMWNVPASENESAAPATEAPATSEAPDAASVESAKSEVKKRKGLGGLMKSWSRVLGTGAGKLRNFAKSHLTTDAMKKKYTTGKTKVRDMMSDLLAEFQSGYQQSTATASEERASQDEMVDRLVKWAAKGQQVHRKDKDLMNDTGGTSKGRYKEPDQKPPREDLRKPFNTKKKSPSDKDKDTDLDADTFLDKDVRRKD